MRALVLGDIHANLAALTAVLEAAPAVDAIYCLGDLVGYGPNPRECVELIRTRADQVVFGNHDQEIVLVCRQPTQDTPRDTDSSKWLHWTARQLGADDVAYLASLPEEVELKLDRKLVRLRHDLPLPGPLIMPDATMEQIEARLDDRAFDFMFVGHVHMPYRRQLNKGQLIDVGSVGQAEHGEGNAAYALWVDGQVSFHRTDYDLERTIRDMRALPLSQSYLQFWSEFWRKGFVDRPALGRLARGQDAAR
jgi:predicted phosphodiesterase